MWLFLFCFARIQSGNRESIGRINQKSLPPIACALRHECCEFSSFVVRIVALGMELVQIVALIGFVVDSSADCVDHRPFGACFGVVQNVVAESMGMAGMVMEIVVQRLDACLDSSLDFVAASSLAAAVVAVEILVLPSVAFDEVGMASFVAS